MGDAGPVGGPKDGAHVVDAPDVVHQDLDARSCRAGGRAWRLVLLVQSHRGVSGSPASRATAASVVMFQNRKAQTACRVRAEPYPMSYDLAHEVRVSYAAGEGNRVRIDLDEKYENEERLVIVANTIRFFRPCETKHLL